MIIAEAFGRALAVEPYLATIVLGGGALRHAGNEALLAELVPAIVEGKLTLAWRTRSGRRATTSPTPRPPRAPTARAATRWKARRTWCCPATAPTS